MVGRAKFCLHATEGEYMRPRRRKFTKVQKAFFLIFVECQRELHPADTVPDWKPKNRSISEMKICRFIAAETNENIHL